MEIVIVLSCDYVLSCIMNVQLNQIQYRGNLHSILRPGERASASRPATVPRDKGQAGRRVLHPRGLRPLRQDHLHRHEHHRRVLAVVPQGRGAVRGQHAVQRRAGAVASVAARLQGGQAALGHHTQQVQVSALVMIIYELFFLLFKKCYFMEFEC